MTFAASAGLAEADRPPGASIRRLDGRAEVAEPACPRRQAWPGAVGVGSCLWVDAPAVEQSAKIS